MKSRILLTSILLLVTFFIGPSLACTAADGKPIVTLPASILKGWSHPFESSDIGNPLTPGSTRAIDGGVEIIAGGKDIWGMADEFHFVYQKQSGDFDVATRLESLTAPHLYARAGLMARQDLSSDSRHIFFLAFPDNRPRHNNSSAYEFQYREKKGAESHATYPPQNPGSPMFPVDFPNVWVRLKRVRNQFTGLVSNDGKTWKEYGSYSMDLTATIYLGLAATSHIADARTTARFKDLRVLH